MPHWAPTIRVRDAFSSRLSRYTAPPARIILDLDATDDLSMGAELSPNVGFQFSLVWRGEAGIGDQPLS
jgi:hypothetical protein